MILIAALPLTTLGLSYTQHNLNDLGLDQKRDSSERATPSATSAVGTRVPSRAQPSILLALRFLPGSEISV